MIRKPVPTIFGVIDGRDAIYADEAVHKDAELKFCGEINGRLCELRVDAWIRYELLFRGVKAFDCRNVEDSTCHLESSFDEADLSGHFERVKGSPNLTRFILATYDHVYQIAATGFELSETSRRPFTTLKNR